MSVETWGEMPKSQIDNEKPEEMVARLIAVHEADPTAHAGADESIDVHRKNTVIDHPAGSIPADKISFYELHFQNYFVSASNYDVTGHAYQPGYAQVYLNDFHVANAYSDMTIPIPMFQNATFPEKDIMCQWGGSINWYNSSDAVDIMFGGSDDGFGFTVRNNAIYARLCVNSTEYLSSALTFGKGYNHIFRIVISPADNQAYFYIDGALVASLVLHAKGAPDFGNLFISETSTATSYASIGVSNLEMSYMLDIIE